jgi:hypothetical protein
VRSSTSWIRSTPKLGWWSRKSSPSPKSVQPEMAGIRGAATESGQLEVGPSGGGDEAAAGKARRTRQSGSTRR